MQLKITNISQLAFYVNLHRAVIGPSATLTGWWRPDIDLRRMLTGYMFDLQGPLPHLCNITMKHITKTTTQLAFYVNLHRAVIGPSATLTGRWRPDIDLRRMLTGHMFDLQGPLPHLCNITMKHITKTTTQLAFYVNLHRAVIGPSATLTGRWWPDIDLRRMLTGMKESKEQCEERTKAGQQPLSAAFGGLFPWLWTSMCTVYICVFMCL